jgi:hypothetical protein
MSAPPTIKRTAAPRRAPARKRPNSAVQKQSAGRALSKTKTLSKTPGGALSTVLSKTLSKTLGKMPGKRRSKPRGKSRSNKRAWQRWLPSARTRKAAARAFSGSPPLVQLLVVGLLTLTLWSGLNWVYQVARKPTELFFPVSGALAKMPAVTWRTYEPLFRAHATATMTPELLAALAQVEGAGNPVARTYWRWRFSWNPFEIYRPASSAVGMYQITDGTFEAAQRYCIHAGAVVEDGPWHDLHSCWFNSLYFRVLPSHAIEMTSALLDRSVAQILARHKIGNATLQQRQDLATLIHLCGAGAGDAYARRGLRLADGQRCGDHSAQAYLAQVNAMKRQFARLATQP